MSNNYKQIGPFIYGDPRFLSGGSSSRNITYNDDCVSISKSDLRVPSVRPNTSTYEQMIALGQCVSSGKSGYHGNRSTNSFVTRDDLDMPTVGIEVETILRECDAEGACKFTRSLYSNWFHAENDGSLDQAHSGTYGYEIVTTVLPARFYRDINLWTGFQNIVSPLVYSYSSGETGLHVHVGMDYFENTKFPAASTDTLILFGKILTSSIYYSFLPRSMAQRVFLRNSDLHYCRETHNYQMTRPLKPSSGYELLDNVMNIMLSPNTGVESHGMELLSSADFKQPFSSPRGPLRDISRQGTSLSSNVLSYGHDSEINSSPRLTLEFRRGKGTTNALSIHRMIELCVLTVLYAGHIVDNPQENVSTKSMLSFIIENTKSQALKSLTEKEFQKLSY